MWCSPMTKSLDPILVTALRVGLPLECLGSATGGITSNCLLPVASGQIIMPKKINCKILVMIIVTVAVIVTIIIIVIMIKSLLLLSYNYLVIIGTIFPEKTQFFHMQKQ